MPNSSHDFVRRCDTPRSSSLGRGGVVCALAACLVALGVSATVVPAQQRPSPTPAAVNHLETDDGGRVPIGRPTGFRLFAEEDLAWGGMHMTGDFGWGFPNVGPCPFYLNTTPRGFCGGTVNQNGGTTQPYFEIALVAGAPIHEFRKIRDVHPGVRNMLPPVGYSTPFTFYLASPNVKRWGPGDGQFGNFFSGAVSTQDGSCRDVSGFRSGSQNPNFTLLAMSNCPETWSSRGFQGRRPVLADSMAAAFSRDPSGFTFDEWKLPSSAFDQSRFMGNVATYGLISDSYREIIQRFGSVTPLGGNSLPLERGYPLGLEVRFDAYQYARPSIRHVVYWELTVVNRSADIYGTGVDYDSLYMGVMPGYLHSGSPQAVAWYLDFQRNAIIGTGGNLSGRCSANFPKQFPGVGGCIHVTGGNVGFGPTGQAIMLLKSPLGDMRNKLRTRPGPFFSPTSPYADDTITFNHARVGGFGGTQNGSFLRSDRAAFGYISSTEDNFLDGRAATDFTPAQIWTHFQNENFAGAVTPEVARFNRFVPGATTQPPSAPNPGQPYGSWDYNNDGVQDTIYVPHCGRSGCSALYSDTVAAGIHNRANNVANSVTAGPFALAAGDTVKFLYAFVGAKSQSEFEFFVNQAIEAYLNFFAGPEAIPAPTFTLADVSVVPAEVRDSLVGQQNTEIRIRIPNAASTADPFVASVLARLRNPSATDSAAQRIVRINDTSLLFAALQRRANVNYSQLLVFKSCDRGATFTVTTDCRPARATDVTGVGLIFGWQPDTIINVDSLTGRLNLNFYRDVVQAGRTYTYSFVTRTRGLVDIPVLDSIGGTLRQTNLGAALRTDADTITGPLLRSGPSVVQVYAPITLPAGSRVATLDTTRLSRQATRFLTATTSGLTVPGEYHVLFGNRFVFITRFDSVTRQDTVRELVVERVLTRATPPGGTATANFVASSDTFAFSPTLLRQGITTRVVTRGTIGGDSAIFETIRPTLGYVIARDSVAGTPGPALFFSATLANPPAEFQTTREFPGFLLTLEAPPAASTPRRITTRAGAAAAGVLLRAPGDTLNPGVVEGNGVIYQAGLSARLSPGGEYRVVWADDAFGPASPFRITTRQELEDAVNASLARRAVGMTTSTDSASKVLAVAAINTLPAAQRTFAQSGARPLVAAKVPFTVTTPNGTPATLLMFRRDTAGMSSADSASRNTILIGNRPDTVRIAVPHDVWMPGDTLIMLEAVQRDSVVGTGATATTILKDTIIAGRTVRVPVLQTDTIVGFPRFVMGCTAGVLTPTRTTCNPLALNTVGATGYLPYKAGWTLALHFVRDFDLFSEFQIDAAAPTIATRTNRGRDQVSVVPNPFVVQSTFNEVNAGRVGESRVMFVNVPEQGVLRIYTVGGQFIQQLSWTPADLERNCRVTDSGETGCQLTGDLPYDLRSREGLELGAGLYLYVLTATGPNANGFAARGKFVVIR